MASAHPQAAWVALLALLMPIALATLLVLLHDRARLRRERDALQARALDTQRAIDSIVETMRVALFYMRQDAQGARCFPYVAGRTERFMDRRAEQIMAHGDCWLQSLVDGDRAVVERAIQRSVAESRPILADVRMRRQRGIGWIRLGTGLPERQPDGAIIWKGYWADTTAEHEQARALAQAKSAAETSAEAKARFLAAMSHEIRTPLATVIGALDLLRNTALDAAQRVHFDLADNAARLLMEIIGDILDFSRLEAGNVESDAVPFEPRVLLEQVLRVFDLQVRRKGLALTLDMDDRIAPWLLGDPVRIKQIALNLVGNAVKFTAQGGIRVGLRLESPPQADPQRVVLSVADTGIGISEVAQGHLFEPFTQADASTARQYGGSGLGLSVSQRLAGLMGGSIRFHSKLGQGSTFEVHLPLAPAAPPSSGQGRMPLSHEPAATPPARVPADNADARVLVVDDHEPYRIILRQQLANQGMACDVVASGDQALAALASRPYTLLITDYQMPGMDGCELARRIRQQETGTGRRLPILLLTADLAAEQMQRCRDGGVDDCLIKPVTADALRHCLEKWIN